jgi:hypothetical protein
LRVSDLNQRIAVCPDVVSREVDGETFLLDLSGKVYYGLDAVGTRVWQLLLENGQLQAVLERLVREFEVDRERLETDVLQLMEELAAAGLVRLERSERATS